MSLPRLLALLALVAACHPACAALQVTLAGQVAEPGSKTLAEGSRLNDLLEHHAVDENAFFPGASWQRRSAQAEQQSLLQGILFDLKNLQQQALLNGFAELATLAGQLHERFAALPVTGRLRHELDPAALIGTDINHRLEDGDRLVFPPRPAVVTVTGASHTTCVLPFVPLQQPGHYLQQCPPGPAADRGEVLVIQPDGAVFREGLALWNRGPDRFIAPGTVLLVPIDERHLDDDQRSLNRDMAVFLATQEPAAADTP